MPHINKFSLWKKLKRLLTAVAPHSILHAKTSRNKHHDITPENSADDLDTESEVNVNSESGTQNKPPTANTNKMLDSNDTDAKKPKLQATADSNFQSDDFKKIDAQSEDFEGEEQAPITDYLKQYMHDKQWHYTYYRPTSSDSQQSHHLSLRMTNKQIDCGYLFRVQEGSSLLAIYGILPFFIPESHQSTAMLLITQINYDMLIGNLELDVNDGEIRYKNAIDVEAVGIDDDIIEHLLQSVIAMTTVAYEIFSDLINTEDPTQDMQTLLSELHQQADARTFFLPTQLVQ